MPTTKNLPALKINKLTKEQYERELAAGNIDEDALYLTPDEDTELIAQILAKATEIEEIANEIKDKATSAEAKATSAETKANQAQTAVADKAPMYSYGTEDLEAGVSELPSGTLYFVYE